MIIPPSPSRVSAGAAMAAGLLLVVTGCVEGGGRADSTDAPIPAMPSVTLPPRQPNTAAEEILREGEKLADARDFPGVLRLIDRLWDPAERARVTTRLVGVLSGRDVQLAADFVTALPAGYVRDASIAIVAQARVQRDGLAALDWAMQRVDVSSAVVARRVVVDELVRRDPRSAIDRVLALPASAVREDLLVGAAAAWARRDPNAAVDWVRALPDDERKQRLTSTIAFEIAQANPDRALALAETLPLGRNRWLLFSAIGQTWVARDPKAALAWANRLPAGEPRDAAFAGIDTGLGVPTSRHVGAAPGVIGGGSRARGGVAPDLAWPEISSPDFAAWLATQRPGMSREEAILEYVRQRGAVQPWAIGPWLASMPGGPARDQATEIFVDGLMSSSPAEAARWLSTLPRSDRSDEMMEKTVKRWLLTNPDAAEIWLRDAPLAPLRKEEILRAVGR